MKSKLAVVIMCSLWILLVFSPFPKFNLFKVSTNQNHEIPWWNENWKYRQPIYITNPSVDSLYNYQVNVLLNFINFDFMEAKADGSYLRFIHYKSTDGTQKWIADEYTVALWHFDEGEGNKALDASKYGNHGFLYNTIWDRDTTFSSGSSLKFNGNNTYVEVPYSSILDLISAFTIEAWIKPNDTYNGQFILVKKSDPYWGFNYALGIGGEPGGAKAFNRAWFSYYSIEGQRCIISDVTLEPGKWYHIAGVKNGWSNWLYINNSLVAYGVDENQTPKAGSEPLYIGAFLTPGYGIRGSFLNGTIDEVRILSRALTELSVLEPKSTKIGGTTTFTINATYGYERVINLSVKVLKNSQVIFTLNATKISETAWRTTEWDTTKHPEGTYQLQAEVLDIFGNTLTIHLIYIQVEQSITFKILSALPVLPILISSIIIIAIPLVLVIKGFKPKWYHFLFFPALFIILIATYDILKPTWEDIFSTSPWASTILTFSIVMAMFILWTITLKEEKDQENVKENTNRISDIRSSLL